MSNRIVDLVIKDAYDQLGRKGITGEQRIEALRKQFITIRDEASALRILADVVEEESTAAKVRKRAATAAETARELEQRGVGSADVGGIGPVMMLNKGAHVSRMEQLAKAAQLARELPALRNRLTAATTASRVALHELSARSGGAISPVERERLQNAVNEKDADEKSAARDLHQVEEQIAKLRG